jgi:hypothetical protein
MYVITGWSVYAKIGTTTYPATFQTIDSTSGLYKVGPIYGTSDAKTYTIYINNLNVDSVSYGQT